MTERQTAPKKPALKRGNPFEAPPISSRPSPLDIIAAAAERSRIAAESHAKFFKIPHVELVHPRLMLIQPYCSVSDGKYSAYTLFTELAFKNAAAVKLQNAALPPKGVRAVYALFLKWLEAMSAQAVFRDSFAEVFCASTAGDAIATGHLFSRAPASAAAASNDAVVLSSAPSTVPPAPRLVGIETNPGPPKGHAKKKTAVVVVKKSNGKPKSTAVIVRGRGDYRPTAFARTRGRGDYSTDIGSNLGGAAGKFLGGMAGGAIGKIASPFLKLIGMGDYKALGPKSNSLYERDASGPVHAPHQISSLVGGNRNPMNMGACSVQFGASAPRVTHREYIGPIYGGSGFTTRVYRIQPGLVGPLSMFPWGSSIAKCFQQYRLRGMILEYKSTSTNFATGTALGTVMMSTLYDAEATPLASVAEVDNNDFTTSDAPCNSIIHPIECAPSQNMVDVRYVRTSNAQSTSTDDRLSDVGLFQISTNGLSAADTVQIGELWCSYDIEFLKPALVDQHVGTTFQATGVSPSAGGTAPFLNPVYDPENSLPATLTASNALTFPRGYNGNYLVVYSATSTTSTITSFTLSTVGSDITPINLFQSVSGTGTSAGGTTGYGTNTITYVFPISTIGNNTPDSANTLTFNTVAYAGPSTGSWTLLVVPLDNDITSYRDRALKMLKALPDEAFLRDYINALRPPSLLIDEDVEYDECKEDQNPTRGGREMFSPPSHASSSSQRPAAFFSRHKSSTPM